MIIENKEVLWVLQRRPAGAGRGPHRVNVTFSRRLTSPPASFAAYPPPPVSDRIRSWAWRNSYSKYMHYVVHTNLGSSHQQVSGRYVQEERRAAVYLWFYASSVCTSVLFFLLHNFLSDHMNEWKCFIIETNPAVRLLYFVVSFRQEFVRVALPFIYFVDFFFIA